MSPPNRTLRLTLFFLFLTCMIHPVSKAVSLGSTDRMTGGSVEWRKEPNQLINKRKMEESEATFVTGGVLGSLLFGTKGNWPFGLLDLIMVGAILFLGFRLLKSRHDLPHDGHDSQDIPPFSE
ncbi:hypothetical protein ACQZV8_13500 [Magnetococcales bacterium HHB-1]